jgi:hypothetical protein
MSSAINEMEIFLWNMLSFMWTLLHGDTLPVTRYCVIMTASVWHDKDTSTECVDPIGNLMQCEDIVKSRNVTF